jgi:putative transposase
VFVEKYRYKVLEGDVGLKVRELVRQTCEAFGIEIKKGVVSQDHVHVPVSAPPNLAPSEVMRRIKGRCSAKLFESSPELWKRYWGQHFRARDYLCVTLGESWSIIFNQKWTTTSGLKLDGPFGPYPDFSTLYEPTSFKLAVVWFYKTKTTDI